MDLGLCEVVDDDILQDPSHNILNREIIPVLNVYKPYSCTPLEVVTHIKEKYPLYSRRKIGYAGRLDPMARGVLILLVGDENRIRKDYESMDKSYLFACLMGVSTDTYDILGEITGYDPEYKPITLEHLQNVCNQFLGKRKQEYPPYSSVRVRGKLLFEWAKEGRLDEVEIPSKEIEVYSIEALDNISEISMSNFYEFVEKRIHLLKSGDFRQEMVLEGWRKLKEQHPDRKFVYFNIRTHCSQGTYIRTICQQIGEVLGTKTVTIDLLRESVGDFLLSDAISVFDE